MILNFKKTKNTQNTLMLSYDPHNYPHYMIILSSIFIIIPSEVHDVPSVLWRCWLGNRNGIRPLKRPATANPRDYFLMPA